MKVLTTVRKFIIDKRYEEALINMINRSDQLTAVLLLSLQLEFHMLILMRKNLM